MTPETISGSIVMMFLYDVCESIEAQKLRTILGAPPGSREPFHRSQGHVAFSVPPVIEPAEPVAIDGAPGTVRVVWFEYGVMSLTIEVPFSGTWREVAELTSLWMNAPDPEKEAARIREIHLNKARPALIDEYKEKLTEDYCVILLPPIMDSNGGIVRAENLIEERGRHIAQIVRGETCAFSKAELNEILQSRTSYYETDLLVVGWSSAFVYDTPEGAALSLQLLEYANSQLLEFRHYDGILTQLLSSVYRKLERGTGPLARWRLAGEAERLNLIRLDIRELTERADNSVKFLSDMFAARLYRMAAARIGVPDYRIPLEQKLQSAGDLYTFMMDRFYEGRAFVLEMIVVLILVIELALLFRH